MSILDRIDAIAKKVERFVSGNAVASPLYLTNRTLGQKIRFGLLVGTPALAVAALIGLALNSAFDRSPATGRSAANDRKAPTGEITAKVLQHVEKDFTTEYSRDVDVIE